MARLRRDWYLEGWSREYCETDGKTRMVWKYTGEYFRYELSPRGLRRLKAACALLTVLMAALWFHLSMLRVAGREFFFVGAEWFLCIIPFMVLILGAASFLTVRERMTYRAMYGSYKRCRYSKGRRLRACVHADRKSPRHGAFARSDHEKCPAVAGRGAGDPGDRL